MFVLAPVKWLGPDWVQQHPYLSSLVMLVAFWAAYRLFSTHDTLNRWAEERHEEEKLAHALYEQEAQTLALLRKVPKYQHRAEHHS